MQLSNSKWKDSSNLQHRVTLGVVTSLIYVIRRREKKLKRKAELYYDNSGSPKIRRARRTVEEVYECLGDVYFKRAYRMTYESFRKLADKISPYMQQGDLGYARVNGPISDSSCIAVSLS
jgi:hypothetical protein